MAVPRRLYFLIPVTGIAVAVTFAVLLLARERRDAGGGVETPSATLLVFAEFGTTADRVYSADASDPSARSLLATIEHAPEWGINPALRPAGTRSAYTVLPPSGQAAREAPAELWLLDVATGERRLLASDADLVTAPVFDRGGERVVYRGNGELGRQSLVSVDLASGERRALFTTETAFGVYPVGFSNDDALLFASLSRAGTELYRLRPGGQPELVVHASDGVARDWDVSPDGERVSFLAPETRNERVVHRVHVIELGSSTPVTVGAAREDDAVEQFSPVWHPEGAAITLGREAYPDASASVATYSLAGGTPEALAGPERGYDVPLAWSDDGAYLAVRSFDGVTAFEPGEERLVVVAADGERHVVPGQRELLFLGWVGRDG